VLLKPWRDLCTDLKEEDQSWSETYQLFLESAPELVLRVISGIQYFHECDNAAKDRNVTEEVLPGFGDAVGNDVDDEAVVTSEAEHINQTLEITDQDLADVIALHI
jgi:hypothetical protein